MTLLRNRKQIAHVSLVVYHIVALLVLSHADYFINDLDKNMVAIFIRYVEVVKLGRIVNTLDDQKFTTG